MIDAKNDMKMPTLTASTLPLPRFQLREVRAFLALAAELHFGRAALRLATSQSALSRTIRNLEEAVGVSLLERTTRHVRLTSAGEAFAAECGVALSHLARAGRAAADAASGDGGRLRVGYMDFAINGVLPSLLQQFRRQFPRVVLDLEYSPSSRQKLALLEGRIDIGFVIGESASPRVRQLPIQQHDFVALLPDTHALSARSEVHLAELAAEDFVMGTEEAFGSFRRIFFPLCHGAGFFPSIVQEASNSSGIFGLVAAGVGVSVYADCARNTGRSGVVVRPLAGISERIPTYATWVEDNPSEALHSFQAFLAQAQA